MHPLAPIASTNLIVPFHEVPSPRWFSDALDSLARFYRFVDLSAIEDCASSRGRGNSLCHVTFDDGHASFAEHALAILERRRIPATLFVSPAVVRDGVNYWFQDLEAVRRRLGEGPIREELSAALGCAMERLAPFSIFSAFLCLPIAAIRATLRRVAERWRIDPFPRRNMNLDQLRGAAASGVVTIGAHTLSHPVLANETDADAEREIGASVTELSQLIDRTVDRFAYPNGAEGLDFTAREQRLLAKHGVTAAVTTDVGFVRRGADRLALPRGGCPSLEGDSSVWRLARLALLPIWDRARALTHPGRASQAAERRAIRALTAS